MPRLPIRTTSPLEDKVRRLEEELYMARATIIGLMQPELERLLWGQVSCKTFEEVRKWIDESLLSTAESGASARLPYFDGGYYRFRRIDRPLWRHANCPPKTVKAGSS